MLRYNKRGATFDHVADQPQILDESTLADLVEDALQAFDTLASQTHYLRVSRQVVFELLHVTASPLRVVRILPHGLLR